MRYALRDFTRYPETRGWPSQSASRESRRFVTLEDVIRMKSGWLARIEGILTFASSSQDRRYVSTIAAAI